MMNCLSRILIYVTPNRVHHPYINLICQFVLNQLGSERHIQINGKCIIHNDVSTDTFINDMKLIKLEGKIRKLI